MAQKRGYTVEPLTESIQLHTPAKKSRQSTMSDRQPTTSNQAVSDDRLKASASNDSPKASVPDTRFQKDLYASRIRIIDPRKTFDAIEGKGIEWKKYDILVNYATKLDESDLCYLLPDMYEALCFLLGHSVDYIKATTEPIEKGIVNFPIEMYLLGYYEGTQPLGPFWKPGFSEKFDENPDDVIKPRVARILKYARALHNDLNTSSQERLKIWQDSYIAGYVYLTLHRRIVREVGRMLECYMEDHDLTKTRVVQIALGYMWHWIDTTRDRMSDEERELQELGKDCIKAGHLEYEDHHPEFEVAAFGDCDAIFLVVDRVAVHVQKDKNDNQKGWDMNLAFIPGPREGDDMSKYMRKWLEIKEKYQDKNLYEAWDKAHELKIMSPSFDDDSTATGRQEADSSAVQVELQSDGGR